MMQLRELTELLDLDRHVLPRNGPDDPSGCANSSTSLPGPDLLGVNQKIWLTLLKLGRFLEDLSSRLEGGKALDPKLSIGVLESNIDNLLFLLSFDVTHHEEPEFIVPSPKRSLAARSRPGETRRPGDDPGLIGLTEASQSYIAEHVYPVQSEDHIWHAHDERDGRFLEAFGLPPRLDPCVSYEQGKVPLREVSPGSQAGPEPPQPVVLHAPNGLIAVRPSTELILEAIKGRTPSRQRAARLVGVGSRFKDINRPIGIQELFFLRLLSGTKQVRSDSRHGRTSVSESDAVDEFDYWVKLGLLTFNKGKIGRKKEEEGSHTRLTKLWNAFKGQMGSISPALGGLFDAQWPDSTSKVYSIGLVPGAVEDRLCDTTTLSAELRSTQLR